MISIQVHDEEEFKQIIRMFKSDTSKFLPFYEPYKVTNGYIVIKDDKDICLIEWDQHPDIEIIEQNIDGKRYCELILNNRDVIIVDKPKALLMGVQLINGNKNYIYWCSSANIKDFSTSNKDVVDKVMSLRNEYHSNVAKRGLSYCEGV